MAREEIRSFDERHLDGCGALPFGLRLGAVDGAVDGGGARERLAEIYYAPAFGGLEGTVGGEFVGLAMGNSVRRAAGRGFYLHELCVRTEMRGSGVGRRLLACLEDRLREAGVESIFVVFGLGTPAAGFCAKNGYAKAASVAAMVEAP